MSDKIDVVMYILSYYSTYELIHVHIYWTKNGKIYIEGILIEYSTFLYDGRLVSVSS